MLLITYTLKSACSVEKKSSDNKIHNLHLPNPEDATLLVNLVVSEKIKTFQC